MCERLTSTIACLEGPSSLRGHSLSNRFAASLAEVRRIIAHFLRTSTNSCFHWVVHSGAEAAHHHPLDYWLLLNMSASKVLPKGSENVLKAYLPLFNSSIFTTGGHQGYDCTDHNNTVTGNGGGGGQQQQNNNGGNGGDNDQPKANNDNQAMIEDARMFLPTMQMFPDEELNREEIRLRTFDHQNWNVPFLDKRKLAQIGLYYLGTQDVVKCHFCRVEIGKWEQDDDCFTEHYRWSSSCPLLRRHHTNNIPIDAEALDRILPPVTFDTCGPGGGVTRRPNAYAERSFTPNFDNDLGSSSSSASDDDVHISPNFMTATAVSSSANTQFYASQSPFYNVLTTPHLEIEANRLKTFKEWPINLKMKPIELSDAGFFYTGMGDRVQCFSCGGGLKNWEDDDVAWEQHALWYGNCEYLKLIKGQKYIDAVVEKHRRLQEENELEDGDEDSEEVEEDVEREGGAAALSSSTSSSVRLIEAEASSSSSAPATCLKRKRLQRRQINKNCDAHPESDVRNLEVAAGPGSSGKSEVPESKTCKICFECEFNTAFIPCGHVVACAKCASAVTKCPMCREPFDSVTRIYFS